MLALVVVPGVCAVVGGLALLSARGELLGLRSSSDVTADAAREALSRARDRAVLADRVLGPWDPVLGWIPLVGSTLRAEVHLAGTARALLDAADEGLQAASGLDTRAGQVDVDGLRQVERSVRPHAERAAASMAALDRSADAPLPPGVRGLVDEARTTLRPAATGAQELTEGLGALRGLLGGSGRRELLVALQNNAELRGTGGYVASFATGSARDGRVTLDPLREVLEVGDPAASARRVPAPPEYSQDFAPLSGNTTVFRSWNMSPETPDSALVGARIVGELLGTTPDVVVLLDVPAMGVLAQLGGGDVEVGGRRVSAEDLEQALLVDAYDEAGDADESQNARRAALQAAAQAVVERLFSQPLAIEQAAPALLDLVRERHLQVWSARAPEQEVLARLGVAGTLVRDKGEDLAHVSVNNIGANKLDLYVQRDVDVEVRVGTEFAEVRQQVTFRNEAPEDLVPYVAGERAPGSSINRVELSIPAQGQLRATRRDGLPLLGTVRKGRDRTRVAARIELPRGRTTTVTVDYLLPLTDGRYRLAAVPQPLARPATLRVVVRAAPGGTLRRADGTGTARAQLEQSGAFTRTRRLAVDLQAGS